MIFLVGSYINTEKPVGNTRLPLGWFSKLVSIATSTHNNEMISSLWRGEIMDVSGDDLGFDYEIEISEDDNGKVAK